MNKPTLLGITALALAVTVAPLNVKAAGVNCTRPGNLNQVVIVGGNCDINNLPGQVQVDIQAIIENFLQNGLGNNGNKPGSGTENVPNVESPDTDEPNIDAPDTDEPNIDAPDTDAPNTEVPDTEAPKPDGPNTEAPKPDSPNTDNDITQNPADSSYAQQVVNLVNAERAKEGLPPLRFDVNITNAANIRAIEIQSVFSHTRPNGNNFYTILTEKGISYRKCGENIAYGQKTPQEVVTGWMNSAGHRANIMDKNFKNIGVGYQVKNGIAYWVQLFTL